MKIKLVKIATLLVAFFASSTVLAVGTCCALGVMCCVGGAPCCP